MVSLSVNHEIHHILLDCGYRYTPASGLPSDSWLHVKVPGIGYYVKDYETNVGVFSVALYLNKDPHTELPFAIIYKMPESLNGRLLPHVTHEGSFCYVDQQEGDWDPNDLVSLYTAVDEKISSTLDIVATSSDLSAEVDREFEGEFAAYWESKERLFLITRAHRNESLSTYLLKSVDAGKTATELNEFVTVSKDSDISQESFSKWANQRKLQVDQLKRDSIKTHFISVTPTKLTGETWPPRSLPDVLEWLKRVDHNARAKLVEHLTAAGPTKSHICIMDVANQAKLAFYVQLTHRTTAVKWRRKGRRQKTSINHAASVLGSKHASKCFVRLGVVEAHSAALLSRNSKRPGLDNLGSKRIALIGCGTIGGYLAGLLLRSGAGCGNCQYDLYDPDVFSPQNFGRHPLTSRDFGEYKAKALARSLSESIHTATNIQGKAKEFPISKDSLSNYDLIIDATGRPPVSKRLACVVRELVPAKRPMIIHAFNDGNGRAAKVLVDDGNCCYECMRSDVGTHTKGIDRRFLNINDELHISCGSAYTPYDAAVSYMSAALAAQAALNSLEMQLPWTYNEHILDGSRTRKPKLLRTQPNCPICHAHAG
ncbi:molybdopterin/thiamine biosynthesis adenylyltransferase [Idiomarina loihiensis]|uniref:E2/UBC family protein n=1 Tax=Idiomarina sp. H2 TaxID=2183987 RepID=UPI000D8F7A19|nr:E2/UBC family protein [Idiomarina sp. H2]PWW40291.1 molybdopterin/thiamine biosynthesis adenylyltransferase [Idiomarina loihiensis]TDP49982.1 molybdopterin/thiamine biosynthesis adenylyltransferase [Idiomarina loihiensis]TDS24666.1 molybdopterin/thiamine biosynthesis adenylyltransferase [Idiomarina sp. H2]